MSAALQLWCCEDRRGNFVEVFQRSAVAQGFDLRLFAPRGSLPADFAALIRTYRHLSPNPAPFELAVFRRWFEVRDALAGSAPARFVVADSDLLLLAPPAAHAEWRETEGLVGSRGVTDEVTETDISPHFSFWTIELLRDFCAFIVRTYAEGAERLAAIHAARTAAREPHVSISDMTLLALWVADHGITFTETNRLRGDRYLDHNIGMASCADARFVCRHGRKAIDMRGSGLTLRTVAGDTVRPLLLHFVGRNKALMLAVEARRGARLAVQSAALAGARAVAQRLRR